MFGFFLSFCKFVCLVLLLFQQISRCKKKNAFLLLLIFRFYCYLFFFLQVRVVLYKNGSEVLSMLFNAVGSDKLNWFSQARLLSSPWSDLKTASKLQHFDITGSHKRYFEITYLYGGCPGDVGWLVVGNGACPWERHGSSNSSSIRFSKLKGKTNWNNFSKKFSFINPRFQ